MDAIIKKLKSTYSSMKTRSKFRALKNGLNEDSFEIIGIDEFINWSINESSLLLLMDEWELAGKTRATCPSIDKIQPEKGYIIGNLQWLTISENSRKYTKNHLPARSKKSKNKRKDESKLNKILSFRMTEYERHFVQGLADIYAGGNLSLYMIHAAFNCERKFITKDDIPESNRRIIKGKNRKGSFLAPPSKH
jgi:hypothetical protein